MTATQGIYTAGCASQRAAGALMRGAMRVRGVRRQRALRLTVKHCTQALANTMQNEISKDQMQTTSQHVFYEIVQYSRPAYRGCLVIEKQLPSNLLQNHGNDKTDPGQIILLTNHPKKAFNDRCYLFHVPGHPWRAAEQQGTKHEQHRPSFASSCCCSSCLMN
jgi:hypothetical protein